jgi:hypothetical protein
MIDYVADFRDKIRERSVLPGIQPGYLEKLIPKLPPEKGEPWDAIMRDVEPCIMAGVTMKNLFTNIIL